MNENQNNDQADAPLNPAEHQETAEQRVEQFQDRLADRALFELLGAETPPDLSAKILAAAVNGAPADGAAADAADPSRASAPEVPLPPPVEVAPKASRAAGPSRRMLAVAASVLLLLSACAAWLLLPRGQRSEAPPVAMAPLMDESKSMAANEPRDLGVARPGKLAQVGSEIQSYSGHTGQGQKVGTTVQPGFSVNSNAGKSITVYPTKASVHSEAEVLSDVRRGPPGPPMPGPPGSPTHGPVVTVQNGQDRYSATRHSKDTSTKTWTDTGGEGTVKEFPGNLSLVVTGTSDSSRASKNPDGGFQSGKPLAGFDPKLSPLPSGSTMTASAIVSADRRYVRITAAPFISPDGKKSKSIEGNVADLPTEYRGVVREYFKALGNDAGKNKDAVVLFTDGRNKGEAGGKLFRVEVLPQERGEPDTEEGHGPGQGGDRYRRIIENAFLGVAENPLSTFSIDVDTASYSNLRQFILQQRTLPPPDAVRIEELLNYFPYKYAGPKDNEAPFAANTEVAECPWRADHRLVRIALKGREIARDKRPRANLVFLADVSGSMNEPNRLPLLKQGLKLLVEHLRDDDRVAIVTYAGNEGLALPSTPGGSRETIAAVIDKLEAGGSTNGGAGIQLAYRIAQENFVPKGVNRVILCTDGDFNVGTTSDAALERLAEEKARQGSFLTVLGFGRGNLNDSLLKAISSKANGNYAYIDTVSEAHKVLVDQLDGTLVTIAKDVKIQVEFNPAKVAGYRLIGYENRVLKSEDFNDDKKDAGDIGAGHTVTALYEVVPAGKPVEAAAVDALKYQTPQKLTEAAGRDEIATLKLRYKEPDGEKSRLVEFPVRDAGHKFAAATSDFQFAAAVAEFGLLLRGSQHKGTATLAAVEEIATQHKGEDKFGYRGEFLEIVRKAKALSRTERDAAER